MLLRLVISTLLTGCVLLASCASTEPARPFEPPTSPQWVKFHERDDIGRTFYYDPASIEKHGNFRLVWVMHDLKQREEGDLSQLGQWEYDCEQQRGRILKFACYAEPMARGDPSCIREPTPEWQYPEAEMLEHVRIVCE